MNQMLFSKKLGESNSALLSESIFNLSKYLRVNSQVKGGIYLGSMGIINRDQMYALTENEYNFSFAHDCKRNMLHHITEML